jgi:hypothetical protein
MMQASTLVLLSALSMSPPPAEGPSRLPIISDDYVRARAEANRRQVPLVVEVWAPW